MNNINPSAESVRESARQGNGQFGEQAKDAATNTTLPVRPEDRIRTSEMYLVYTDSKGVQHFQPWAYIEETGGMIDPDDGSDLTLAGWTNNAAGAPLNVPMDLIWKDADGDEHRQPFRDFPEVGGLIDPETGDDMELVGWASANDGNGRKVATLTEGDIIDIEPLAAKWGSEEDRMYAEDQYAIVMKPVEVDEAHGHILLSTDQGDYAVPLDQVLEYAGNENDAVAQAAAVMGVAEERGSKLPSVDPNSIVYKANPNG